MLPKTPEKTITTISKGEDGKEVEGSMTKEELITQPKKEEEENWNMDD